MISCSNNEDELLISSEGPPAFPHVFMGNAYVNGQPIKEGIVIYAEFGNSQSEIERTYYRLNNMLNMEKLGFFREQISKKNELQVTGD